MNNEFYSSLCLKLPRLGPLNELLLIEADPSPMIQIRAMANCSTEAEGNIVNWNSEMWKTSEQVNTYDIAVETLCRKEKSFYIFSESLNYQESFRLCSKAGLPMAIPRSLQEEESLYSQGERFLSQCKLSVSAHSFLWLGARKSPCHKDIFTDESGRVLNYTHFVLPFVESQKCAALIEGPHFGWNDVSCEDRFCPACEERDVRPLLTLRGLWDRESWESNEFILDQEDLDGSLYFRGLENYNIRRSKNGTTWYLKDTWRNITVGQLSVPSESYPLGTRSWSIHGNKSLLTFSACSENDFTCADGSCIPIESRCDLHVDCRDSSDEEKCSKIVYSKRYITFLPPPSANASDALGIQVSVDVFGVSEIDALRSFVAVGLILRMSWYDSRLTFQNLQDLEDINRVESDHWPWMPSYIFENADLSSSSSSRPNVMIRKVGPPLEDSKTRHLPGISSLSLILLFAFKMV